MEYGFSLPFEEWTEAVIDSVEEAMEEKTERMAYERWLSVYPYMVVPTNGAKKPLLKLTPFSEYYRKVKNPKQKEERTNEEILDRMKAVIEFNQGEGKTQGSE